MSSSAPQPRQFCQYGNTVASFRVIHKEPRSELLLNWFLFNSNRLDFITGKRPTKRNEIWYFTESTLGAARIGDFKYRFIDQPGGWLGGTVKVDWPILINLRLDPFERTGITGSMGYINWYMYEFWRYVYVQQEVEKLGKSFIEFPPMQKPASFNLEAVKEQIKRAIQSHAGQ